MSSDQALLTELNLHAVLERSRANGPGERMVIWFQGCPLDCPGCFNPDTHDAGPRQLWTVAEMLARIRAAGEAVEGITISGGEPFAQAQGLRQLLAGVREQGPLSVLVFTGYTLAELERRTEARACLAFIDVLIAGRYVHRRRQARELLGSSNQSIHLLSDRYRTADLQQVPELEAIIDADGNAVLTGVGLGQ